jgi:hypothetical protein
MTDFRELCAELLEIAELYSDGGPVYEPFEQILNKARAVLARWGTSNNTINQED